MKVSVIASNLTHEVLAIGGALSADHLHEIAESFIGGTTRTPFKRRVVKTFGHHYFKSYVIEYSSSIRARITFSMHVKPGLLLYKRGVVAVAPEHAEKLEIYIDTCEVLPLHASSKTVHRHDAGVNNG